MVCLYQEFWQLLCISTLHYDAPFLVIPALPPLTHLILAANNPSDSLCRDSTRSPLLSCAHTVLQGQLCPSPPIPKSSAPLFSAAKVSIFIDKKVREHFPAASNTHAFANKICLYTWLTNKWLYRLQLNCYTISAKYPLPPKVADLFEK